MDSAEYDFWLLDLDGTLVDIEQPYIYDVFEKVGQKLDASFTDREAELLWYGIGQARNDLLAEKLIERETFWDTFHEIEQPETRAAATYLYDDASSFVPELDGPVGVVTHCQEYLTRPVLSALDIEDWFDTVVCCTDETGWKPDPEPVQRAMDDLGVGQNGHVGVLVGDDPQDIGAAQNAGLDSVHVRRRVYERLSPRLRDEGEVLSMGADRRVSTLRNL
ncbi:HAD family hydrolase [Halovenus rubra]|uniref:HAD family hydrolase n=2 Tax=Halovenus rubra TaxID=869890 RepID=A0ABD5X1T4_9EURY|nr:HAD family hydrolase [Halovenus rubra]